MACENVPVHEQVFREPVQSLETISDEHGKVVWANLNLNIQARDRPNSE